MKWAKQNNAQNGFTIIEVVLVLAIAGLIFLIVFIALPALQRSQRDTQRRSDMGRIMSAITTYKSNVGTMPNLATMNSTVITGYLKAGGSTFSDPTGGDYTFVSTYPPDTPGAGEIQFVPGWRCKADGTTEAFTGGIVLRMKLENGGFHCQNPGSGGIG